LVARLKESNTPKESNETELLMNILRQNEELKTMLLEERKEFQEERQKIQEQNAVLIEYCKEPRETKNNFNLNVFLNVQCKDAVNMTDFIRDLEIQVEDVENVGKLGFVECISRIISIWMFMPAVLSCQGCQTFIRPKICC
jgi:hypothetical protein